MWLSRCQSRWSGFDCSRPPDDDKSLAPVKCSLCDGEKKTKRIRWIHVPKTGTTFANTVLRSACDSLPDYAAMRAVAGQNLRHAPHGMIVPYFSSCFPRAVRACRLDGGFKFVEGHHVIQSFNPNSVAYVTMLREPFSRLVSSYHDNFHDCKRCRGMSLLDYARSEETWGIYARYFVGNVKDAAEAVKRTKWRLAQFAFVGIVEQWSRSVCLYHSAIGGKAMPISAEIVDTVRKSPLHNQTTLAELAALIRNDAHERNAEAERREDGDVPYRKGANVRDFALVDEQIYLIALAQFEDAVRESENSRCLERRVI